MEMRSLVAGLFGLLGMACSGCRGTQPAQDHDTDSATSDAAPPLDTAVASDTVDSALPDVSMNEDVGDLADAYPDSPLATGHWGKLAIYPDCPPTIALDPEVAVPPLKWVPCASGRAGCRTVVVDWCDRTDLGPAGRASYPGIVKVGGKGYFAMTRACHYWRTNVVYDGFDGKAAFASVQGPYLPISCSIGASVGGPGLALSGGVAGKSRPPSIDETPIVGFAPWGSFTNPTFKFIDRKEFGCVTASGTMNGLVAGEKQAFSITYLPNAVQPFNLSTLTPIRSTNFSGYPVIVPDGALTSDLSEAGGLLLVKDDASFVTWTLPAPRPGKKPLVSWHSFDQTTRADVGFIETDYDGASPVLWTANYDPDPAKVVRRRLGALPSTTPYGGRGVVMNGGVILVTTSATQAALYRASDGAGWVITAEPGTELSEPLWVDDDEVVLQTLKPKELPSNILRMKRSALGEPTLKLTP